jgi:hypothetical protein
MIGSDTASVYFCPAPSRPVDGLDIGKRDLGIFVLRPRQVEDRGGKKDMIPIEICGDA